MKVLDVVNPTAALLFEKKKKRRKKPKIKNAFSKARRGFGVFYGGYYGVGGWGNDSGAGDGDGGDGGGE